MYFGHHPHPSVNKIEKKKNEQKWRKRQNDFGGRVATIKLIYVSGQICVAILGLIWQSRRLVIVMAMVSLAQISGLGIGFCGSGISDFAEEWEYEVVPSGFSACLLFGRAKRFTTC